MCVCVCMYVCSYIYPPPLRLFLFLRAQAGTLTSLIKTVLTSGKCITYQCRYRNRCDAEKVPPTASPAKTLHRPLARVSGSQSHGIT